LKTLAPRWVLSSLAIVGLLLGAGWSAPAFSQTPSPLQEWQYSSGIVLYKMFKSDVPDWQIETGLAETSRPLYTGSNDYRQLTGPVIDVRYKDIAFASIGEGLGVNLLRGDNYRAGIALGYDMGREAHDDLTQLKGLGNITSAPVVKLFASYAISRSFPLVFNMDVRQYVGGADGVVGDFSIYAPLPGSSEKLVMFAGPSITLATRLHMQTEFGVSATQSAASGYEPYMAHGGLEQAGFGFSATRFFGKHWFLNMDLAASRLFGSADESPVSKTGVQGVLDVAVAYKW
jgi:outer membrane scaffolding protein for murein synthesis (MipA/OmpV family)